MSRVLSLILLLIAASVMAAGQTVQGNAPKQPVRIDSHVTSSPAFAELLLRRTELEAGLDSLLIDYTEDFPKVLESRQGLLYIERESLRLSRVKPPDASKLTLALGKLIVRKIELELDLWNLLRTYKDEHPDVKRAKRKVEIFETAIKEILG